MRACGGISSTAKNAKVAGRVKSTGPGNFRFKKCLRFFPALLPAIFEFLIFLQYYPKDCRAVQNLHMTNAK
jgi:hypothetical protein